MQDLHCIQQLLEDCALPFADITPEKLNNFFSFSLDKTIVGVIDYNLPLYKALASARVHHQYLPDLVQLGPGALTAAERETLRARGHTL